MANKDQFDLDIQVKPVNVNTQDTFNGRGGTASQSCNGTGMCTVTLSCKCY